MATKAARIRERVVAALNEEATPPTARQQILDEASDLTHQSRNTAYGSPEDNFRNIANLWNAYLAAKRGQQVNGYIVSEITAADVAIMMILMKSARLATNPNHHDSCVDIAGYAACLGDVQAAAQQIHAGSNLSNPVPFSEQELAAYNKVRSYREMEKMQDEVRQNMERSALTETNERTPRRR